MARIYSTNINTQIISSKPPSDFIYFIFTLFPQLILQKWYVEPVCRLPGILQIKFSLQIATDINLIALIATSALTLSISACLQTGRRTITHLLFFQIFGT